MATAEECKKFIDDAATHRRKLGEARQMIQSANVIVSQVERNGKSHPVWLQNALIRLREALTYEEGQY